MCTKDTYLILSSIEGHTRYNCLRFWIYVFTLISLLKAPFFLIGSALGHFLPLSLSYVSTHFLGSERWSIYKLARAFGMKNELGSPDVRKQSYKLVAQTP